MLCLQLKPTVIRKKKSILLDSYGSPDSDGARQGQLLQLAKVRYERKADAELTCFIAIKMLPLPFLSPGIKLMNKNPIMMLNLHFR